MPGATCGIHFVRLRTPRHPEDRRTRFPEEHTLADVSTAGSMPTGEPVYHISFPRHMSYETMSRRVAIMTAACEEFGMKFVLETAPDPTTDVGVAGAQAYILEKVPEWVEKYGTKAAYFCTNDAHTEPLLKQLLEYGGYFIEADLPSPTMGYPGAAWNGSNYTNAQTGVKADNTFLIYQDTYIMGNPGRYMGSTSVQVPEKYFTIA